jgi:hypothetical protein
MHCAACDGTRLKQQWTAGHLAQRHAVGQHVTYEQYCVVVCILLDRCIWTTEWTVSADGTITDLEWVHVGITIGNDVLVYLNGQQAGSLSKAAAYTGVSSVSNCLAMHDLCVFDHRYWRQSARRVESMGRQLVIARFVELRLLDCAPLETIACTGMIDEFMLWPQMLSVQGVMPAQQSCHHTCVIVPYECRYALDVRVVQCAMERTSCSNPRTACTLALGQVWSCM